MDVLLRLLLRGRLRRRLLVILGVRRITPRWGERSPGPGDLGGPGQDTGGSGWYRPPHRRQDPSVDPREPNGGESSSRGNDHGWANCTMAAGAMALDYATLGGLAHWGGDLRHRQGDLDGGTDLYDLRDAWGAYGEVLTIRSGAGWSALLADLDDGHPVVIQGQGNVPGSATFDGGHACAISPETRSGDDLLFGDPLASGWQWVTRSSVKAWAQAWNSSISYAIGEAHKPSSSPPPTPTPEPDPCPDCPPDRSAEADALGYARGLQDGANAQGDAVLRSWRGTWTPDSPPGITWDLGEWDRHRWVQPWPIPMGLVAAQAAAGPAAWDGAWWSAGRWQGDRPELDGTAAWDLAAWPVTWRGAV